MKLVLCDFDGVVVDSNSIKRDAYGTIFESVPGAVAVLAAVLKEQPSGTRSTIIREVFARLGSSAYKRWPDIAAATRHFVELYGRHVDGLVAVCPEVKGATRGLEFLAARFPVYLVSNTPEASLKPIVEKRGLNRFFKEVLGVPPTKQAHAERILDKEGVAGADTVVLGDTRADYRLAVDIGARFIGFKDPINDFPRNGVSVVDDWDDFVERFGRQPSARS